MASLSSGGSRLRSFSYTNPVFDGYFADPFVFRYGEKFYAVGTGGRPARGGELEFPMLRSDDLVNWEPLGGALLRADDVERNYWAPEIAERARQSVVCLGVAGPQLRGARGAARRFVEPLEPRTDQRAQHMRFGVVGNEREVGVDGGQGVRRVLRLVQDVRQIEMCERLFRLKRDGPLQMRNRLGESALLAADAAEQIECAVVVGVRIEQRRADCGRAGGIAGFVEVERGVDRRDGLA